MSEEELKQMSGDELIGIIKAQRFEIKEKNLLIQELRDTIDNQREEIDRLNKEYERIYNENCKLRENHNINDITLLDENNRLKNIIDELEKWCNECIDNHIIARENGVTTISDTFFEIVLDKLKTLKENNKDV